MTELAARMKQYEQTSDYQLIRRMPVIIRLDGRAFHTYTKKIRAKRPFDTKLMNAMVSAAYCLSKHIQGFKASYIQSDEVTILLTDYDDLKTQGWFDYRHSKIVSVSASLMTKYFNQIYHFNEVSEEDKYPFAVFDSRAFNVPREDVVNNFLWRALDWERNSIQMYCQSLFSHKELIGKNRQNMHDMLYSVGKNWATDLTDMQKNGTFLIYRKGLDLKERHDVLPNYKSIEQVIGHLI